MSNCYVLDIEFDYNGQRQQIYPVILEDENELILIDCGYPQFIPHLEEAANRHQLSLASITKLIVTHHDMDHIGSLAALKRAYPYIEIISHELEKPYIEGKKKSLRLEQAESTLNEIPEAYRSSAEQFIQFLQSIETVGVDVSVSSAEVLPWCDGIEVVHTPGHMPGHISLYLAQTRTLIAADAIVIEDGQLNIANPQHALDLDEAVKSVEALLRYDINQLICYHGGIFQGDIEEGLQQLIQKYK